MISSGYVEAASVVASSGSEKRAIGATSESNCSGGIFCAGSCSVVVVVITCDWACGIGDWAAADGCCARVNDGADINVTNVVTVQKNVLQNSNDKSRNLIVSLPFRQISDIWDKGRY